MPTPVTKQHLSRGGIHLNDKGQQKLTAAMAEVFNNHAAILSILSCLHDLTWVLPHIRTAVALGSYYLAF